MFFKQNLKQHPSICFRRSCCVFCRVWEPGKSLCPWPPTSLPWNTTREVLALLGVLCQNHWSSTTTYQCHFPWLLSSPKRGPTSGLAAWNSLFFGCLLVHSGLGSNVTASRRPSPHPLHRNPPSNLTLLFALFLPQYCLLLEVTLFIDWLLIIISLEHKLR